MSKNYEEILTQYRAERQVERELWTAIETDILAAVESAAGDGVVITDLVRGLCRKLNTSQGKVFSVIWQLEYQGRTKIGPGGKRLFLVVKKKTVR